MTSTSGAPRRSVPAWALGGGVLVLAVAGLVWAKWAPYAAKVPSVAGSHSLGSSILAGHAPAPPGVSLSAGLEFAGAYFLAIWPALVVGLVLAAAVQVALPADWLHRAFGRSATSGAALAVPSMMCSCCAAPLAVGCSSASRRWSRASACSPARSRRPSACSAPRGDGVDLRNLSACSPDRDATPPTPGTMVV